MSRSWILLLALALPGCALWSRERTAPPPAESAAAPEASPEKKAPAKEPFDIARMESSEEKEEERPTPVLDDAERQRLTKQRFPGASELELVRVVFWPEERSGVCWTEIDPAGKMPLEVRYSVGDDGKEISGSSFRELREQGWLGIYRTPAGTGFERRADFRMVDLTVTPEFRCRCFATEKAEEGSHIPVRVRFRWKGPGNMPEVSARAGKGGKATGLKAGFSTGNLFTYEFPVVGSFPDDRPGRCGGNVVISLLLQPPML